MKMPLSYSSSGLFILGLGEREREREVSRAGIFQSGLILAIFVVDYHL